MERPVTLLDVTPHDLARLSELDAVDVFRRLLWAEARRCGIGAVSIDVPSAITVPDGGVDAVVESKAPMGLSWLQSGRTHFQIKTGAFSARNHSEIKKLLHTGDRELKPRIRTCLESGGLFAVVLFGSDVPDREDDDSVKAIQREIGVIAPQLGEAAIQIWRQNVLISHLEPFPSLCLRVNRRNLDGAFTHEAWAKLDDMQRAFYPGPRQEEQIETIRTELRQRVGAVHVHVRGEPGVGKTRLVLEALRQNDLEPLVLYFANAQRFTDGSLSAELSHPDSCAHLIVVLDECDPATRATAWNRCKQLGNRIAVVSISHESERTTGTTRFLDVDHLPEEQISKIIQAYGIYEFDAPRWAKLCGGSPRVAHMMGANLRENPDDLLREPDTERVWDRYIDGSESTQSELARRRRLVLRSIALFTHLGMGEHFAREFEAVAAFVRRLDPSITPALFSEIVRYYRTQRILQGDYTLYITPKLLHVKLWCDWWDNYSGDFGDAAKVLEKLCGGLPESLIEGLFGMFEYASSSQAAKRVVGELLGERGPFVGSEAWLDSEFGSHLFLALASADPSQALQLLTRIMDRWDVERVRAFRRGRRNVVSALERIVVWHSTFTGAARALLALAEGENENWANNASGVFAEVFSLSYGAIAPTEASPSDRLMVLKEALASPSKERRQLALRGFKKALEMPDVKSRLVGSEYQGLRPPPALWTPRTWEELWQAYRVYWSALLEATTNLEPEEASAAAEVAVDAARGLVRCEPLFAMCLDGVEHLYEEKLLDKRHLIAHLAEMERRNRARLNEEQRARLATLTGQVTGQSLADRLFRYVGMRLHWDQFDDEGKEEPNFGNRLKELAREAMASPADLTSQLPWLVTDDAENAIWFGVEVGNLDTDCSLLEAILAEQRKRPEVRAPLFLAGYLQALAVRDRRLWEDTLDRISIESLLARYVPFFTRQAGLTERAADRISRLLDAGFVEGVALRIFAWGGKTFEQLRTSSVEPWFLRLLHERDPVSQYILIELLDAYYVRDSAERLMPVELGREALLHAAFFSEDEAVATAPQMFDYQWARVAQLFIRQHPAEQLGITTKLAEHLGTNIALFRTSRSKTEEVLMAGVTAHPTEAWEVVARGLESPEYRRVHAFERWLRGDNPADPHARGGMLDAFPRDVVLRWAAEDPATRAPRLAHCATPSLAEAGAGPTMAHELLSRYGDDQRVGSAIFCNLMSGFSWGPEHQRYEELQAQLVKAKASEANGRVRKWLDDTISCLDEQIQQAKVRDEREGRT